MGSASERSWSNSSSRRRAPRGNHLAHGWIEAQWGGPRKKKCADTRKAERWFKERGIRVQNIELTEKGFSPGELKSEEGSTRS